MTRVRPYGDSIEQRAVLRPEICNKKRAIHIFKAKVLRGNAPVIVDNNIIFLASSAANGDR